MARTIAVTLVLILFPVFPLLAADDFLSGKVIGISDGDTITVLDGQAQKKIRLYGIDCPESRQDFGTRARQFTSDLVFNKPVRVAGQGTDRYGRVVGLVYTGAICVNEEILRAGLAWVYDEYCQIPLCAAWKNLEERAREQGAGLWRHPDPVPPWEFRRNSRETASNHTPARETGAVIYHGNTVSMIFHQPSCRSYNCRNCSAVFGSREEAIRAGFRPCGACRP